MSDIERIFAINLLHTNEQRWQEAKEQWANGDLAAWFVTLGTQRLLSKKFGAGEIRKLNDEDLFRLVDMAYMAIGELMERVNRDKERTE